MKLLSKSDKVDNKVIYNIELDVNNEVDEIIYYLIDAQMKINSEFSWEFQNRIEAAYLKLKEIQKRESELVKCLTLDQLKEVVEEHIKSNYSLNFKQLAAFNEEFTWTEFSIFIFITLMHDEDFILCGNLMKAYLSLEDEERQEYDAILKYLKLNHPAIYNDIWVKVYD